MWERVHTKPGAWMFAAAAASTTARGKPPKCHHRGAQTRTVRPRGRGAQTLTVRPRGRLRRGHSRDEGRTGAGYGGSERRARRERPPAGESVYTTPQGGFTLPAAGREGGERPLRGAGFFRG